MTNDIIRYGEIVIDYESTYIDKENLTHFVRIRVVIYDNIRYCVLSDNGNMELFKEMK